MKNVKSLLYAAIVAALVSFLVGFIVSHAIGQGMRNLGLYLLNLSQSRVNDRAGFRNEHMLDMWPR